ncbi:MAG: hypothetical protein IKF39_00060 [Oscillospiraceae bacterium]|nr:hypothetical protein [Oscillospiraceae bacterium]
MKRIFRLFFLFLIPFFLIRFSTLAETDSSTGFFTGGKYGHFLYIVSLALAALTSFVAAIRFRRLQVVPEAPEAPSLLLQILMCLSALFSLQQLLLPPLTSHISSRALSVGVFFVYVASHLLSAAFFFLLAINKSLPSTVLSDLFASSPAVAFASQMLFLYAQEPVNLHDSLTVLTLLCEASLAVAWLRYCSALLAGSTAAFPSAVGFSTLALYLSVGFRLPEVFIAAPSFLRIISILHHVFCSLTLMVMTLDSIPDSRKQSADASEENDG